MKRAATATVCLLLASAAFAQADTCPDPFYQGRIVTAEEAERATVPGSAKACWTIGWPCRKLFGAMESGLVNFEKGKIREKLYDFQQRLEAPVGLEAAATDRWRRTPIAVVDITTKRRDAAWALPVRIVIGRESGESGQRVLGWRHAPR